MIALATLLAAGLSSAAPSPDCWNRGQVTSRCVAEMTQRGEQRTAPASEIDRMIFAAREGRSDSQVSAFLSTAVENYDLSPIEQAEYLTTATSVRSDRYRQRALSALLFHEKVHPRNYSALVRAASGIESDERLAMVLVQLVRKGQPLGEAAWKEFDRSLETIQNREIRQAVADALLEPGVRARG